jgi:glycogen debranching enzyme
MKRRPFTQEMLWGDGDLAEELRRRAKELKRRFDEDFWMEDREYYALALDGEGQRVDSITSNAGHLLWSGIVPEERSGALVRRLMSPGALFSGWGIRTMSKKTPATALSSTTTARSGLTATRS